MIRLSVLDQSPIRSGGTAADAIGETVQLAQAAERLGYHRYWVAEHHSHGAFAGHVARNFDRPDRLDDEDDSCGLGRGDAQPLQRAQGGRIVQGAGDTPPGPHRFGFGPRPGGR